MVTPYDTLELHHATLLCGNNLPTHHLVFEYSTVAPVSVARFLFASSFIFFASISYGYGYYCHAGARPAPACGQAGGSQGPAE